MAQPATSTSNDAAAVRLDGTKAPAPSPWILGRWPDLALIVGSPILVIGALTISRQIWSGAAISSFVMVWAIGHHLPGMMRAYGDPDLFRRFRLRFLLAPTLLIGVCCFTYFFRINSGLFAIVAVWGWWHYLMQAYGFCRIYDSKVGSFAPTTRWLDQAMCLTWFAAAVILNDNALYAFIENFHNSGLRIPSQAFFETLRSVARGATAAITCLFIVNYAMRFRAGDRASLVKVILMATTFGCFWYSAATVSNIVVAYAFFELFHDIQYLAIVWAFNRNRASKDKNLRGFTRWLFQPRLLFIGLYLLMIAGYGSLKYGSSQVANQQAQALLMAVFMASTLLHYYFDGFIWKLREQGTRKTLDVDSAVAESRRWSLPPLFRHALLWCLFLIPLATMLVSQAMQRIEMNSMDDAAKIQRLVDDSERLAATTPGSFMAQYWLARSYELTGQRAAAIESYQRVLAANPEYTQAQEALRRLESGS